MMVNLPGWCWAEIQQLALVGSSSSLHSEACNALGASDGVIHSSISLEVVSLRASTNNYHNRIHYLQAWLAFMIDCNVIIAIMIARQRFQCAQRRNCNVIMQT